MDPDFIPVNIFVKVFDLEEDLIIKTVRKLEYNLIITIQERKRIIGLKIHRTLQSEIKIYIKEKKNAYRISKKK